MNLTKVGYRPCTLILVSISLCQFFLWAGAASGQAISPSAIPGQTSIRMSEVDNEQCPQEIRLSITLVSLVDEKKVHLDRQAVVKIHDNKKNTDSWDTSDNEGLMVFCYIDYGDYQIDASAVGYLTEHKDLHLAGNVQDRTFQLLMHKDPAAVDLNTPDSAIPAAVRKETKHAILALKSANFKDPNYKEAEKWLAKAYKAAPSNPQINFLYGYMYVERKDFEKAETYLTEAAKFDPQNAQTLTLLGRTQLERHEYEAAQKTLEQAVAANANYWMAHNLLGDAYLKQKQYEKAAEQAQLAIDLSRGEGKGASNEALLVLGQALANLGRDPEGIKALNTFVEANPRNPAVPQVKALIAELQKRDVDGPVAKGKQSDTDLSLIASSPSLPQSAWGPPGVDEVSPAVTAGVTCPFQQVLDATGQRVKEFVDNIAKFAAVEDMEHQQLDKTGNPITKETRKFSYVASITEARPGYLQTDEYRNLRYGITDLPDHIVTSGTMTLALIFHPDMRDNFEMTCEGLGAWKGQNAWIVHFRQRDDKPNRFSDYVVGSRHYPMNMKGRAWITANNLQIVHMDAELVKPLPQLAVQHQIAEYGPVHFQQKNLDLWLPQNVDIFMELNRHYYHRRHIYDHYQLFSVDSADKPGSIKNKNDDKSVIKNALPTKPMVNP